MIQQQPEDLSFEERISLLSQRYTAEAGVYERHWAPGLRTMGRSLLEHLDLGEARAVLDVGTGVGALLPDIEARAPGAVVVGCDRAEGMLSLAPQRFRLAVADATRLPLASDSFDVVTMIFMLFHLPHPVDGLVEARRTLQRGAPVATATWGEDETWPASEIWNEELDRHGAQPPGALMSIHENVDNPEKMAMHLRDAGFADIESWTGTLRREWSLEGFIECVTGMANPKRRLDSLDPEARSRFIEAATERVQDLPASDFLLTADVVFALGKRAR